MFFTHVNCNCAVYRSYRFVFINCGLNMMSVTWTLRTKLIRIFCSEREPPTNKQHYTVCVFNHRVTLICVFFLALAHHFMCVFLTTVSKFFLCVFKTIIPHFRVFVILAIIQHVSLSVFQNIIPHYKYRIIDRNTGKETCGIIAKSTIYNRQE